MVRKARGWAWTKEQEEFFISQVEEYGPVWADIAARYCKPGKILEGRDQIKLKDKARNIKEKCIRYDPPRHLCIFGWVLLGRVLVFWGSGWGLMCREGRALPRHFEGVTPIGNFTEAKERLKAAGKL